MAKKQAEPVFSTKTKDPRQMDLPLDRFNVEPQGTDKNLLMEYIEATPIGTKVIPSRYNPLGGKCDA